MVKIGTPEIDGVFSEKMSKTTVIIVSVSTVVLGAIMIAGLIFYCRRRRAKRDKLDDEEAARKVANEARLLKMQQLDPTLLGLGTLPSSSSSSPHVTKIMTAAEATRLGAAEAATMTGTEKGGKSAAIPPPMYSQQDKNKEHTTKA